ncbi:amino acid adenylation domain-containing protein [Nostoc sp.]|uniref:amino acid adenylation domain-containing protein n=1 Tax=Nostoc sp. TaxID=1180 RepID=UPI002FFC2710
MKNIEDSYPLSPMQQGMLFHSLHAPHSGVYIEQLVCALHENLDISVFKRVWQQLIERHSVLRTSFRWEGVNKPLQDVHKQVTLQWEQQDWCGVSAKQQEKQLEAYLQADRLRGFDFTEAPLMRLALFRVAKADYRFIWTFHHVLLDGRSLLLVLKELFTCYEALSQDQELHLEQPDNYRNYIDWLGKQDFVRAQSFWQRSLKGFTAPTPLVVDKVGSLKSEEEGFGKQGIRLSHTLTKALQSLAQEHQLTLNTLVQGAWSLLLSRYSGEEDVVFGATRACRLSALKATKSMVGLFINTLPVRTCVSAEESLLPWLKALRTQWLAMRDYEHTPLVQVQGWSDITSGQPLFESIVVFENYLWNSSLRSLGKSWQNREFQLLEQTTYPLVLTGYREPELLLEIEYARYRFNDTIITRMLGHIKTLLESMVANPEQRLSDLLLLTAAERHQLLVWNNTQTDYPRDRCIHQLFEAQVERTPDAIAVVFEDRRLTYRELNCRANQLAHYLQALRVVPEVLVGICMERSIEMVVGLLGILKAGGAYVPLDPSYPSERLAFMLESAFVPVLLTQALLAESLPKHQAQIVCLDRDSEGIARQNEENPVVRVMPNNLAYVIYTSGSTGKPKGVSILHRSVVRLVKETNYANFSAEAVFLQLAPISFDASTFEIWGSLLNGGQLVVMPAATPSLQELAQTIQQHQVTTLHLTAGLFHLMVDEQLESLKNVRQLLAGGDVLSVSHVKKVLQELKECILIHCYGPTENTTFTCCYPMTELSQVGNSVPIGRPIANTQVYLLDDHLHPVPVGVPGDLYIGGEGLARGYLNRPDLTQEKFIPNPFSNESDSRLYKTGDLARYLSDGNIEFLGRLDNQVKIRGFRIELGEIEAAIAQHPSVRETVVVARQDVPDRKYLAAYIVSNPSSTLTSSVLRSFLKEKLPDYMIPGAIVMLDALPLTPNGKINRQALPIPQTPQREIQTNNLAPRTWTEERLAQIWQEVLRIEQVSIHDNFFELGGDSILSIQIISKAKQLGLQFTSKQLFQYQTIADLSAVISTHLPLLPEQGLVTGSVSLTPIQHWFFEQNLPDLHHYNQSVMLEVSPDLKPELLKQIVSQLLLHHDALRLKFVLSETGWQQINVSQDERVPLTVLDLSEIPSNKQQAAILTASASLQASLNLSQAAIVQVALFRLGVDQPSRLLFIVHHLAVDGVSWRILLEDFVTAYQQLSLGKEIQLPPKTTAFKDWSHRLKSYAQTETVRAELDYWQAQSWSSVVALPVDYSLGKEANTMDSAAQVRVSLSEEQTRALLQEVPSAYNTQINDALLTALVQSFAQSYGMRSLFIDLEGHGREELFEDMNLSRTVGWFTTKFPILLKLTEVDHPGEALKLIKEQLRRLPNRGIGYGLLQYLNQDSATRLKLKSFPQAEVSFNYLGQFDQIQSEAPLLGWAKESISLERSVLGNRSHLLEVNGLIVGDKLQLDWTYSKNIHKQSTVENLAFGFIEALKSLIAHCRLRQAKNYTPSDFPEAELNQEELDKIIAQLTK